MSKRELLAKWTAEELFLPPPNLIDTTPTLPGFRGDRETLDYVLNTSMDLDTMNIRVYVLAIVRAKTNEKEVVRVHYMEQQHINVGRYQWRWLVRNQSGAVKPAFEVDFEDWFDKFDMAAVKAYFIERMLKTEQPKTEQPKTEEKDNASK